MSEEDARARFTELVWMDTGGEPVSHVCGSLDALVLREGQKWKCRGCSTPFTATSGNVFKGRKLSFRKLLAVIVLFANGVNGVAACRTARELKLAYKSAFVLLHKIREAMGADDEAAFLGGVWKVTAPSSEAVFHDCPTQRPVVMSSGPRTRLRRGIGGSSLS